MGKTLLEFTKSLALFLNFQLNLTPIALGSLLGAKEQARIATELYNKENETVSIPFEPNKSIDKNTQDSFNCGYLFLQPLLSGFRFDNMFRNIKDRHSYEYDLNSILSDLIFTRVLKPSSKKSSFEFSQSLLE